MITMTIIILLTIVPLRTQRERHGVERHPGESVGNVEDGVFAEHVADDPEPLGVSETT